MKKLLLIAAFLVTVIPLLGQNIGADLQRIMHLAPAARAQPPAAPNAALDTIVMTLAYYGGMPDRDRIAELFSGPALLAHFRGNAPVREFLLNENLAALLEDYSPPADLSLPDYLENERRGNFLQRLAGDELFSRNGKVDLGKIRQVFTSPPTIDYDLRAAAKAADRQPMGLSTANLVGTALNGLSDWISRRAQEELTYAFLTKLREDLRENDLNHLFPNTSGFLPQLDLLNYKAILPSIRKAFVEDLNAIAFNLGNFLEARDVSSFRDPRVYNVFLIYRILDLEMREVPLADILSFTYGELERARIDTRSQIDLRMARVDTSNAEYQSILSSFDDFLRAQDELNRQFQKAEDLLSEQFFSPVVSAVMSPQFTGSNAKEFVQKAADIFQPVDAEKLPLKNNYWETKPDPPATGIVRSWLRGEEAYAYYEAYPSLTRFDELFGPDAVTFDPQERRAAGLTAVRELLAQRSDLEEYRTQFDRLLEARADLLQLRQEVKNQQLADSLARVSVASRKKTLLTDLDAEYGVSPHPALRLLRKVGEEIRVDQPTARKQLAATERRLADWVLAQGSSTSPYAQKMRSGPVEAASLPPLQQAIDATDEAYDQLFQAVQRYSSSQADSLVRAYHNLTTFETVFGMAQQAFFLLAEADSDLFLDKKGLAVFQTDPGARQLLSGISQERIARVPSLGQLNASGLSDFLLDFGLFLTDYRARSFRDDLEGLDRRSIRRVQTVDFITGTLEAFLTAPILRSTTAEGGTLTLAERFPAFADVPAVSRELNELFRLSQTGEYRYAVDNLLTLLKLFDVAPTAGKKQRRLTERRDELRQLILDHVVEQDRDLQAIALAPPSAESLPLLGEDKRDNARLMTYNSQLQTEKDPFSREELTNSIRDLKVKRIREELQAVEKKLARFNPERTDRFRERLFKYGTFMADVANANSPGEFEAALNTVALPVGSSQIKRNRPSSFELGAYFGAALSRERLVLPAGVEAPELEEEVFGASLFVPVGVSYSRNIGGRKSITFFGSLLDLGALTAFRLESRSDNAAARVERLPEFRPANVIAPGFHAMYNFPKSPFTLGIGVQDGPSVRKFTLEGGSQEREARSIRGMVTLSVDVPIFRFFNR